MAQRIVKNMTGSPIYIGDLGEKEIPAYGEIDFAQCYTLTQLSNSEDLMIALSKDIVNKYSTYLILNDGANDLEADDAIDLIRNLQQRTNQSADGDWKVVTREPSTITGNKVIDKSVSAFLDSEGSFNKKFIIPNNKIWYLQSFGASSDKTTGQVCLKYYNDDGIVQDPFICPIHDYDCVTAQAYVAGTRTISIENFNNEIEDVVLNQYYKIVDLLNTTINELVKIISKDKGNNTITFQYGFENNYSIGSRMAFVSKPIRKIVTDKKSVILKFNSPLKFVGTGQNYLKMGIHNLDPIEDTDIFTFFNGWEEPA